MPQETAHVYEFGPFRLDAGARLLLREGHPVPLTPKAVETLLVLVEGGGAVVGREELIRRVWADTFVEENNLSVNVSALRKALGSAPDGRPYIETLPRRGYRFAAGVKRVAVNGHDGVVIERGARERLVVIEEEHADELKALFPPELKATGVEAGPGRGAGRAVLIAVAVSLTAVLGLLLYARQPGERKRPGASQAIKSLAVLPLKALGPEGQGENYLGVGLADALITRLGGLGEISVRPTSAVLRFNDPRQDSLAAARTLGVEAVLEGSYQRAGDRVRVTVQLVSAGDGAQLWSGAFEDEFGNIFAVQDSISAEVARSLVAGLSGAEERLVAKRPTASVEAYQHYMKGRFYWNKRTSEDGAKALAHFEQALALDPNYAQAYSGVADCYALRTALPPTEALPRAKAAALKAVELDDALAEPHASLGLIKEFLDLDRAGAEAEYRRALELNPNYALARGYYAMLLTNLGRFDEGAEQARRAKELDPTSPSLHLYAGWNFYFSRQFDRSIEEARKSIELDPSIKTCSILARAYAAKGMYETAVAEGIEAKAVPSNFTHALGVLGHIHAVAGQTREARELLAELKESSEQGYVSPYNMAIIHAALGEKSQALRHLEAGLQARDGMLYFIKVDPLLDGLRSDPGFEALLRRAGFAS